MARIFWDTNAFIYLFEDHPEWAPRLVGFRQGMIARGDHLLTSWLTVGECLTKPREVGNAVVERSYWQFFEGGTIRLVPFEGEAARRYSLIRSQCKVGAADAIQLACAAAAGTDLFVTNDLRLTRLSVPGITFIAPIERLPY
jgi:predicted nucleic acid-binding protein